LYRPRIGHNVRIVIYMRIRLTGHVARTRKKKYAYSTLVGKSLISYLLGRERLILR